MKAHTYRKRYVVTMNRRKKEREEEKREERILEQIAAQGRLPTPKPGYFHTPRKRAANRPKNRRTERRELKEVVQDYNRGK
jgi:hypothetical protein